MKLGENLEVALAVKDLPASLEFFKQLGFTQPAEPFTEPHPWIVISDGDIHLGLHQYDEPSPALVYFTNAFQEKADYIERLGIPLVNKMEMDGRLIMIAFQDPNGQGIGVVDLMGAQIEPPEVAAGAKVGAFGEFSIPTKDLKKSMTFWQQFGFEGAAYEQPYPWAILQDGLITLGLHQTDDFSDVTLTYFDKRMPEKIEYVKAQGIVPAWEEKNEQGLVASVQLNAPDGQPLFLFTGDIDSEEAS